VIFNILHVIFKNAYSRAFWGFFGVKWRKWKLFAVLYRSECNDLGLRPIKQRRNRFCDSVSGREQKFGSQKKQKTKNHATLYLTHFPGRLHWSNRFDFWRAGWYPCQILLQSVQGFRSSDTHNFVILHRNSWSRATL